MISRALILLALVICCAKAATLDVEIDGLEPLGSNYFYEGWLIGPDVSPLSTGALTVTGSGAEQTVTVPNNALDTYTGYLVTIEPDDGNDAPSAIHIVGGDFSSSSDNARLTTSFGAALGTDFSGATAGFILATPSEPTADADQGIWFIDNRDGEPSAGLVLPGLPSGWIYELWVVFDGEALSGGVFATGNQADSNGAGPAGGPNDTPAYPGEDFINPARSLLEADAVVISIEPQPDDSTAPFVLKPIFLAGSDIQDTTDFQTVPVSTADFPTGTASFSVEGGDDDNADDNDGNDDNADDDNADDNDGNDDNADDDESSSDSNPIVASLVLVLLASAIFI